MLVQKLRLKKGWSQQQLADASGLSVRTIQRIEAGQAASTETLKSIAAVFEVDFSILDPENAMATMDVSPSDKQEAEAFDYVRKLGQFYRHCFRYLLINLVLIGINLIQSPDRFLLIKAFRLFGPDWMLGAEWEKRQVEKRLGRPL